MKLRREKIIIVIFVFILFFLIYTFLEQIKNFFYNLVLPFQKIFLNISQNINSFFSMILELKNLRVKIEILEKENEQLQAENEILKLLKKENEVLRKALNIGLEKEFKLETVNFIGKDISGDIFLIDKGENFGLKEGEVVITPEKFLIGKIITVYPNFSKVQVFTDKEFSFDVEISEKGINGLVKGQGKFQAKIDFLPKEAEISIGDKVLTSARGGRFPKGIFVGEIEKVEKSDSEFYQKAEIKPAFKIDKLELLFVILNF